MAINLYFSRTKAMKSTPSLSLKQAHTHTHTHTHTLINNNESYRLIEITRNTHTYITPHTDTHIPSLHTHTYTPHPIFHCQHPKFTRKHEHLTKTAIFLNKPAMVLSQLIVRLSECLAGSRGDASWSIKLHSTPKLGVEWSLIDYLIWFWLN